MGAGTLQAIAIDARLLEGFGPGTVIARYRRASILETDSGGLITLAAPELGNGPNAVLVDSRPWSVGARFAPLDDSGLRFSTGPALDWSRGTRWLAADSAPAAPPSIDNADALLAALNHRSIDGGLLPILLGQPPASPIQQAIAQQATPLLAALPDAHAARQLIGLGPGATPAGDDLIAGLLLTLHYARHPAADNLRPIARNAHTTRLGQAQLRWAAEGRARQQTLLLLSDLFSQPAPAALNRLEAVLNYGATSGADLIAGIAIGLRAITTTGRTEAAWNYIS